MLFRRFVLIASMLIALSPLMLSAQRRFEEIRRFDAPEARQGVAVDHAHFFAIGSREIGKYDKKTGELVARWQEKEDGPILHLDSGVIFSGRLYCAHSNYPGIPMTSSVEIWDTGSLQHVESHSFAILKGSLTWIDRCRGFWWAAFAHYDKWKAETRQGTEYTTVVQFDDNWREMESWIFPDTVIDSFRPMSNSGCAWGPDSLLYCTGHDKPEIFAMQLPGSGSLLQLIEKIPIANTGQGIAWDRTDKDVIYTIDKQNRKVIVFQLKGNNRDNR